MADAPQLDCPWLIAVWPGMGHVALSAAYYMMSKLDMNQFAELSAGEDWKLASQLSPEDEQRIESLFQIANGDRSRAFELKSELDRLGVIEIYEDRFLDLFKVP